MILTGAAIGDAIRSGDIAIDPFDEGLLNPNSYNFRLGSVLLLVRDGSTSGPAETREIGPEGFTLLPGILYLAATAELIGSRSLAMTLLGRSSTGRLGLFLNATADLGHRGASSHWTLELSVVQPLRVYAGMRVGQVAFWRTFGDPSSYAGRYLGHREPVPNLDASLIRERVP